MFVDLFLSAGGIGAVFLCWICVECSYYAFGRVGVRDFLLCVGIFLCVFGSPVGECVYGRGSYRGSGFELFI